MAMKSLQRFCNKHEQIELVDSFEDGRKALDYLKSNEIDLMFLDIEMPHLTGLELLDSLDTLPQVIFTTSNKEYAYEAIEYDITDFLKKPIAQLRFDKSVERAIQRQEMLDNISLASASREIYIRTDGKLIRLAYDDIQYFENVGDYIKIISEQGTVVFHGALKHIYTKLRHPRFLKVHRSFIVNLDKIRDIEDNSILINKKIIPISRAHKPILLNHLNILN